MSNIEKKVVNNIRTIAAEMITKVNSGHTGVALGAAPIFYAIMKSLNVSPSDPAYYNRDRFVLCAGHASSIYYAMLNAFGYPITKEDLKNFRRKGFVTKGHPSYDTMRGIDASSGPLGQGLAMAVGMAIAETKLAERFNKKDVSVVDHHTIVFAGDGSMMEGITNEASSLAGQLKLNKLIVLYDSNNITIEGNTNITFTENVLLRYKALGWNTIEVGDGEDISAIESAINIAKLSKDKPTIIKVNTKIGFGSPYENTASIHGKALTAEELKQTKQNLNITEEPFELAKDVQAYLNELIKKKEGIIEKQKKAVSGYLKKYPDEYNELVRWFDDYYSKQINLKDFETQTKDEATRNSGKYVLNQLAKVIPNLISGSADLAPSTGTTIVGGGDYSSEFRSGRNLHFGIREHAMAAVANGIALHGGLRVVVSTFMVFSDYMRHAIRMSAIMKLPVIYLLSHDSIGVGEDGKTHQPVEFNAMHRALPGLCFMRPADRCETIMAYKVALQGNFPSVISVTRQNTKNLSSVTSSDAIKGAYFVSNQEGSDVIIYSSGSELNLALEAQKELNKKGVKVSVVSVFSTFLFDQQSKAYREKIMYRNAKIRVSIEASRDDGWYKFVGIDGIVIGVNDFGFTASSDELFEHFKINSKTIVKEVLKRI